MKTVDVVIPCYNYARYLADCVDTVLQQRDVNVRVLVIDDKSTDDTPNVGAALAARDSRVSFRRNAENLGHIKTFNEGILNWASAEYYTLLSADDALAPGSLARAVAVLDANPDVNLVYGKALLMAGDEKPAPIADPGEAHSRIISSARFLERNCESGNPAPSPAVVLRTAEQHRIGGYNPRMRHTSDMEMWLRFASQAPVAAIQEVQAFYRLHTSNMSNEFNTQALRDRQEVIDTVEEAVTVWYKDLPQAQVWFTDLKRRFADEAYWLAGKAFESGDERLQARLDFAQKHHPSPWTSKAAWSFRVRKALGRDLTNALRPKPKADPTEGVTVSAEAEAHRAQRGEIGWWPETA